MLTTIFPKGRCGCAVLLAAALTASAARAQTGAPAAELEPGADRETGIAGRVLEQSTNRPLAEAPVLVQGPGSGGRLRTLTTDAQGIYRVLLPPGLYTVRSYFDLHHGARIEGVPVERGKILGVNLVLLRIDEDRDVAVVEIEIPYRADTTTAAAQDQLRQAASGIGEGFGAKQMSQVGASDAGAAAKRVVGVTVDRNQLVVRGLGGRYVKVALNGLPIPTTDPDYPSVDLDLFPANVIDSLNVTKAFLPDIPGDWAGGTLDINTITFPRKFTFDLGVSTGLNSETNFHDRLTYDGGSRDFLGYDDGTRALPKVASSQKLRQRRDGPFPTLKDLGAAASTFQNTWEYARTAAVPSLGVDVTIGNSHKLGGNRRFGYLAALAYDYGVARVLGTTRPKPAASPTGDAEEASHYLTETGGELVQLAAIGTASLDLGTDHSVTILSLFNRATENQTKYRDGINTEVSQTARYQKWQLQFLARTLFLNQAFADHRNLFGTRLRLRWSLYHALGYRDEPDLRTTAYGEQSNIPDRWKPSADRLFSDLAQGDYGGTLSLRIPLWGEGWATLGTRVGRSNRTFANRRFQMYELQSGGDPAVYQAGPDFLFGPMGLGTLTYMNEATKPVDGYDARQNQLSAFALLETPVWGPLSFAGGVRLELFDQRVVSASPFPEDNTPELLAMNTTDRRDLNVLPGGALKYQISDKMIARAAYGMTVSRPQVRELAPYDYYDFLRDRIVVGNPRLETATIHNGDLRWEWFFREGQILAFSGFYKKFFHPIELQILNPGTQDSQYVNAKGATSLGAEFEVRSELGSAPVLRHCNAGGNLSLISSQVEIAAEDAGATRGSRRLAGQAPYVVNLSLRCAHPVTPLSGGLVYNVVGPRITDVGVRVANLILPDVEELAFHSLDLLGSWGMGKHLKLSVKVRNLLMQHRVLKQGSLVVQDLKPGLSGSLGLSYEY